MTAAGLFRWLVTHDVRLSACGERLLVNASKGVLAGPIVTELREHKAGLLTIVESGVLSSGRSSPTNADVRAARAKAWRLGVLDVRFPVDNGSDVLQKLTSSPADSYAAMGAEQATMPATVLRDKHRARTTRIPSDGFWP